LTELSPKLRDELLAATPNLRAFAMSLCGNPTRADDLTQETLMKAWDKIGSFQAGTNLKAWLFTILRNVYFSEQRKRKREFEDADGHLSAGLAVHPGQLGHMDAADFMIALQQIPFDQREALILVGAEGFTYEEVADISGVAVGTIKSRVNRARVRLTEILGLDGAGDYGPDRQSQAAMTSGVSGHSK
jgi:RNA polymerase sigma-70 factor, ECF subfamily